MDDPEKELLDLLSDVIACHSRSFVPEPVRSALRDSVGDSEAPPVRLLIEQSRHDSPAFRASAAWAMGEIKNAEFLDALTSLARDDRDKVRQSRRAGVIHAKTNDRNCAPYIGRLREKKLINQRTRKTKNSIFAIPAAAPATPNNPSAPAIKAMIRKISDQCSICCLRT